jgi:hypothetical protein
MSRRHGVIHEEQLGNARMLALAMSPVWVQDLGQRPFPMSEGTIVGLIG